MAQNLPLDTIPPNQMNPLHSFPSSSFRSI